MDLNHRPRPYQLSTSGLLRSATVSYRVDYQRQYRLLAPRTDYHRLLRFLILGGHKMGHSPSVAQGTHGPGCSDQDSPVRRAGCWTLDSSSRSWRVCSRMARTTRSDVTLKCRAISITCHPQFSMVAQLSSNVSSESMSSRLVVQGSTQISLAELGTECRECFRRLCQRLLIVGDVFLPKLRPSGAIGLDGFSARFVFHDLPPS